MYHAWFLLSIWPILLFFGGFQVFVAAFYRWNQGWTLLFQKTWTTRPFPCQNSNSLLDFSFQRKEVVSIYRLAWKNCQTFCSISNDFWTIFASLLELSTFRHSLQPSNILRHSLKSTLATTPAWQMWLTSRCTVWGEGCILTEIYDCVPIW